MTEETTSDTKQNEPNPVEEKARSQGWVPQEEWGGSQEDWVDAKQFIFRGELMDRIRRQGHQLGELETALKTLGEHNKKLAKVEYEKALRSLKSDKKKALQEEDHDAVVELDDQIAELKENDPTKATKPNDDQTGTTSDQDFWKGVQTELPTWVNNESWYARDVAMKGAADLLAYQIRQTNPSFTPSQLLNELSRQIRQEFPHKFGTRKSGRKSPNMNESTDKSGENKSGNGSSKKYTVRDLPEEAREVARTFVKSGVFEKEQEYVDQYFEINPPEGT